VRLTRYCSTFSCEHVGNTVDGSDGQPDHEERTQKTAYWSISCMRLSKNLSFCVRVGLFR
jgi:hypothetical protein